MHPYSHSRLGTGRSAAATATASTSSPPSSPRLRHGRSKFSQGTGSSDTRVGAAKQSLLEKVVVILITSVFKRRGLLLFAPLLYISGMVLYMGSLSFDVDLNSVGGVVVRKRAPPGSMYRSPQVFEKLWPYMEAENNGSRNALMTAWNPKPMQCWKPCSRSITNEDM